MTLSLEEKKYLNLLNIIFGDDFPKLSLLFNQYGSFKKIWEKEKTYHLNKSDLETEWQKLAQKNIDFLSFNDKEYPSLLKEIPSPPLGLYLRGKVSLEKPMLALVGTRKASVYGKVVAEKLTKELVNYGFIIVSGLAWGIDTIVHQSALAHGGETIAVLGSGLDIIFPRINKKLSERIINQGALLSEYPLGSPPLKHHFPLRNRIISGLSLGVIIIEAPEKSGALITAKFALQQNREVFAVPGSIFHQNSTGPHHLIQEGAKLITSVDDILEELNISLFSVKKRKKSISFENQTEEKIYQLLNPEKALLIDTLIEKVNLSTNEVLANLTTLELKGLVKHLGGGNYLRTGN